MSTRLESLCSTGRASIFVQSSACEDRTPRPHRQLGSASCDSFNGAKSTHSGRFWGEEAQNPIILINFFYLIFFFWEGRRVLEKKLISTNTRKNIFLSDFRNDEFRSFSPSHLVLFILTDWLLTQIYSCQGTASADCGTSKYP